MREVSGRSGRRRGSQKPGTVTGDCDVTWGWPGWAKEGWPAVIANAAARTSTAAG